MASESDERTPLVRGRPNPERDNPLEGHANVTEGTGFWRSRRAPVVLCILFTELCERLTFYSISANLVLFCTSQLGIDSATAITITLAFTGTCFFVPVFGGYISDTIAGKFNTIYGSALIYLVGTALLPVISFDYRYASLYPIPEDIKRALFGVALFLIAVGTGGIKSNVGPFGAQQLEGLGEGAIRSFFNWFYWFINVGSGISFSLVVWIQQEQSFFVGYLIPTISILLANFLLLLQRNKYINHPPEGSALTNIVKVTATAACGNGRGCCCCCGDKDRGRDPASSKSGFDRAKTSNGGSYPDYDVESTKTIFRILPIFATFIIYWTIYSQMSSTYFLQGERLNLQLSDNFTLPVAILNLFDVIAILILVPLFDRVLYPALERCGVTFTLLRRIGTGMILAMSSVLVAAIVEIYRKEGMSNGDFTMRELSGEWFNASDISVFVQVPQFALIGASEVFTSVTGLEFAYSQAPVSLQGVLMGLFLMTTGLGSYLGLLLVHLVNSISQKSGNEWLPSEPNHGHLEYFFFLLACLMLLNFVVYLLVANNYQYVSTEPSAAPTEGRGSPLIDSQPQVDTSLQRLRYSLNQRCSTVLGPCHSREEAGSAEASETSTRGLGSSSDNKQTTSGHAPSKTQALYESDMLRYDLA